MVTISMASCFRFYSSYLNKALIGRRQLLYLFSTDLDMHIVLHLFNINFGGHTASQVTYEALLCDTAMISKSWFLTSRGKRSHDVGG